MLPFSAAASRRRRGSPTAVSSPRDDEHGAGVQALAAKLGEPKWIGYTQPIIAGNHEMCDYWNDGRRMTPSTDPIRLEPADHFFVMFRIEEKQITRIRIYSPDCPLDAGGKAVHWFTDVPVTESVSYMKTLRPKRRGSSTIPR